MARELHDEKYYLGEVRACRKKYQAAVSNLRIFRLCDLMDSYKIIDSPHDISHISNITFEIDDEAKLWFVTYKYATDVMRLQSVEITFGFANGKYKIFGNGSRFEIYQSSGGNVRILMKSRENEYDLKIHADLIARELNNRDSPEYFALRVISSIAYNEWEPLDMITYLGQTT